MEYGICIIIIYIRGHKLKIPGGAYGERENGYRVMLTVFRYSPSCIGGGMGLHLILQGKKNEVASGSVSVSNYWKPSHEYRTASTQSLGRALSQIWTFLLPEPQLRPHLSRLLSRYGQGIPQDSRSVFRQQTYNNRHKVLVVQFLRHHIFSVWPLLQSNA